MFVFFVLSLVPLPVFAQWVQPQHGVYAKVGLTTLSSNQGYDTDGDVVPTADFSLTTITAYGEYGVTDWATVIVNGTVLGFASYDGESARFLFPAKVGGRFHLFSNDYFSLSNESSIGFSSGLGNADMAPEANVFFRPTRGLGGFIETSLQPGFSWAFLWASSSVGLRVNLFDQTDTDVFASLRVGADLVLRVTPFASLDFNYAIPAPSEFNVAGGGPTRYLGVTLGASWWLLPNLGITFQRSGAPYAVSNAAVAVWGGGIQFRR